MNNVYSTHPSYKQPPRGGQLYKRVKEIDPTAVGMMRRIRGSLALFSPPYCKLKTAYFIRLFTSAGGGKKIQ